MCFATPVSKCQKTIILGAEGVGKTTLYQHFFNDQHSEIINEEHSMIPVNLKQKQFQLPQHMVYTRLKYTSNKQYTFGQLKCKDVVVNDLPGNEDFQDRWIHYLQAVEALIFVIDPLQDYIDQIICLENIITNPNLKFCKFLFAVNIKTDQFKEKFELDDTKKFKQKIDSVIDELSNIIQKVFIQQNLIGEQRSLITYGDYNKKDGFYDVVLFLKDLF